MARGLSGRSALVTGAGSGIGRAASLMLAEQGVAVAVADVDVDGGNETVARITAAGGDATFVRCDVTDADEVQALVDGVVERHGRLDYAFNNAGVHELPTLTSLVDLDVESFRRVVDVNLTGMFLCLKHELRQMAAQRSGAIVNTSSRNAFIGEEAHTAYTASKHGVLGLTRVAALEHARHGIRINAVCPGPVITPMMTNLLPNAAEVDFSPTIPAGRAAAPEEIAEAALWLLDDAASYVNGHALAVDGGWSAH